MERTHKRVEDNSKKSVHPRSY